MYSREYNQFTSLNVAMRHPRAEVTRCSGRNDSRRSLQIRIPISDLIGSDLYNLVIAQ